MQVETMDLRALTEADARAIAELVCTVWPKPGRTVASVTDLLLSRTSLQHWGDNSGSEAQFPRSFVVRERDGIIAHASVFPRSIGASTGPLTVMALARVCTAPAARGRKLGQAVTRAAFDLIDRGIFPFALFQTTEMVRPFYERLGAVQIHNHFINNRADDPAVSPFWDKVIMRYPSAGGWPAGQIDLRGPAW